LLLAGCLLAWPALHPWRWRHYVLPKLQWTSTRLHGVKSQKIVLFIATTVRSSNPIHIVLVMTVSPPV
jgi:hypothetical protein